MEEGVAGGVAERGWERKSENGKSGGDGGWLRRKAG